MWNIPNLFYYLIKCKGSLYTEQFFLDGPILSRYKIIAWKKFYDKFPARLFHRRPRHGKPPYHSSHGSRFLIAGSGEVEGYNGEMDSFVCNFFFCRILVNLLLYFRAIAMERHGGLILYSYVTRWKDFLRIFLRQDYKSAGTTSAVSTLLHFGSAWFYGLRNSLYYIAFYSTRPVLPFLLLGLIGLRKKKIILFFFIFSFIVWFGLLGKMVFPSPESKTEDIQTVSVYFLPVIPILYSLTAIGFDSIIAFVKKRTWKMIPKVVPYAVAMLPFVLLPYSMKSFSQYNNFIAYDYGHDMLSVLPLKSMFLAL